MLDEGLSISAALIAGLLSFLSPCILPLVPVYLGYMTGTAAQNLGASRRLTTVLHALCFVAGFGLVFVLLGLAAGALGNVLFPLMPYFTRIGGLVLIVFGLHLMGAFSIPWLNVERRLELRGQRRRHYGSSFLVGVIFAAGWTPCIGPVLAAILILAADTQTAVQGALLLLVYAAGLGIPFLIAAGLIDLALPVLKRISRHGRAISLIGGGLLIIMGILLLANLFQPLSFWLAALGAPR
jgi:cytochrome c-type biogenesis protein